MKENKDNIVLIGMPGAGKSTIGVVLAKKLGYRFLDSDLVIQEQTGKLLHELIEEHGLLGFNQIENEINAALDTRHSVIATGGSVIYGKEAMEHLKQIGCMVYLQLSCEELEERLGDLQERGVSKRPEQTLRDLYEERCPLYEKYADVTVNCEDKMIRQVVAEIQMRMSVSFGQSTEDGKNSQEKERLL